MAASDDMIREIFRTELGQEPDEQALAHYRSSGLEGDDLVKSILFTSGRDTSTFNDPAFAAFARQQRAQQAQIEMERNQELARTERNRSLGSRILDRQQDAQLSGVDQDFRSRGMFRAGRRITERSDAIQNVNLQRQQQELAAADNAASTNREAARRLADLSQDRTNQELAARDRLTQKSIQDEQLRRQL